MFDLTLTKSVLKVPCFLKSLFVFIVTADVVAVAVVAVVVVVVAVLLLLFFLLLYCRCLLFKLG